MNFIKLHVVHVIYIWSNLANSNFFITILDLIYVTF